MDLKENLQRYFSGMKLRPGLIFGLIIFSALLAFEVFNYSTTDFALRDLLGELRFANVRWSTILAIAFCGIDFAGIARLFTPQQGSDEPREVWYLFGAWLLAATMNAMLTWWGVSMAIANHSIQSATIMDSNTLLKVVPIFVAVMVWVIRILIIGTISSASDHLISGNAHVNVQASRRPVSAQSQVNRPAVSHSSTPAPSHRPSYNRPAASSSGSSQTLSSMNSSAGLVGRPDPTYHSMRSNPNNQANQQL